ncbi:MAG: alpha/beta hydrolase [Bacteroidota bacterium]
MKIFLKILKWIAVSIGSLLALLILAGLFCRLFGPEVQPPGKLVDVDGVKLHINCSGERSDEPTLVVEGGLGVPSDSYYWLSDGLKDRMRVVRYDRAGIVYSESNQSPRDAETIARELHELLEKSGETPPYILAGHSMGGPLIRVFADLYPDEVVGLFFVDSSHPNQYQNSRTPEDSLARETSMKRGLTVLATLADMGLLTLYNKVAGPILQFEGLPPEINQRTICYSYNGDYPRAAMLENEWINQVFKRAAETTDFGSIPIRVFTATQKGRKPTTEEEKKKSAERLARWVNLQKDIATLSTDGQQVNLDAHHNSIYTKKENADVICQEVLRVVDKWKTQQGKEQEPHSSSSRLVSVAK